MWTFPSEYSIFLESFFANNRGSRKVRTSGKSGTPHFEEKLVGGIIMSGDYYGYTKEKLNNAFHFNGDVWQSLGF